MAAVGTFARTRRHDLPGVIALMALAALEIVGLNVRNLSDEVNQRGPGVLSNGSLQLTPEPGLAGIILPFVIVAWLAGKRSPVRVMFSIAVALSLLNTVTSTIDVLGTIPSHSGNVGAATLLVDAALLWVQSVVIFAVWYWSSDSGGPDLRGTYLAKRPSLEFPQQAHAIHGYEGWVPGFLDYLHASFVTSTSFHPSGIEVLSARTKCVSMLQAIVSVAIILLLVAKAVATFSAS